MAQSKTTDRDTAYLLHHVYERPSGAEEIKLIGVYTSYGAAKAAKARVAPMPGFRDHPKGFEISKTRLDRDGWVEGFVTV